jgi:hypothetical protein
MMRELGLVVAGATAAVILLLACSDDSPGDADAAVCDCPTLTTVQDIRVDEGGAPGTISAVAMCPASSTLVGGGCEVALGGQESELRLFSAGNRSPADPPVYICRWANPMGVTTTITAWATCQVP